MKAWTAPLWELAEMEEVMETLHQERVCVGLTGCVDAQKLQLISGLGEAFANRVIVTYSDLKAKELYEDALFYDPHTVLYPAKDLIFYQADVHGNQLVKERMKTLKRMLCGEPVTVVTTFAALMSPQLPLSVIEKTVISIRQGGQVKERALAAALTAMGYEKTFQVEAQGQFSIRGGIVDIFDLTEENPFRIELWGEEVESIRSFDLLSQRSIEPLTEIAVFPAAELILGEDQMAAGFGKLEAEAKAFSGQLRKEMRTEEAHRVEQMAAQLKEQVLELGAMANLEGYIRYFCEETASFLDFFPKENSCIFLDEPLRLEEQGKAVELEFRESMMHRLEKGYILPGQADLLYGMDEICAALGRRRTAALSALDTRNAVVRPDRKWEMTVRGTASYHNSFETLLKDLRQYKKGGWRILLLCGSRMRARRLADNLLEEGMNAFYSENPEREIQPGEVMLFYGYASKGFAYPMIQFAVMTEGDLFGSEKKKKKKTRKYEGQKIHDFAELKVGDYVVHETHGLGIYQGIEKVEVEKTVKDYIKISYRDGGNLYVLATGLDVIQKYASADAAKKPKLNKLGTQEWHKTKSKVRSAVDEVAKDLVELYAVRQQKEGYCFSEDTVWQREFEEMFPYEETEDQLLAIEATKKDMESRKIMDRLICGDVGYGKTEIAIRAAFKAVQDSKQVVFLVPTTILAQQHYNTFVQRMKDFPVRIDLMSRFRSAAQQKKTIEDLRKGLVDIVIGTHRVLSADLAFKDLGLLIIDEEQRFGVTHKEKIKKLKDDVDVLTLTATPIPRTLHMSLVGIRDMSVLEEAPGERMPVQTYVMEYNDEMIREAIVRELARGGQVFYVYNRVSRIADVAAGVQKLVPEATVAFAHGQMKEQELERIMYEYINGEIDVLVSTTIIETGLDISNANTMIIHDSDRLGLSQLYQLRGRVGRSNRTAYAFLMYKRDKLLKEVAEKRLQAIREFTDLGSGFKIAMRDLEIRGAGNLLGQKQHGHMEAVGYDLYCKMLNEAVKKLKGIQTVEDFTTSVELDVDAFIPASYIVNEQQKLDIYKRIASVENAAESEDMKEELLDRFGSVPESVDNLLRIALIRVKAHSLFLTEIKGKPEWIQMTMRNDAPVHPEHLPALIRASQNKLSFSGRGGVPVFTYRYKKMGMVERDGKQLLTLTEEMLTALERTLF